MTEGSCEDLSLLHVPESGVTQPSPRACRSRQCSRKHSRSSGPQPETSTSSKKSSSLSVLQAASSEDLSLLSVAGSDLKLSPLTAFGSTKFSRNYNRRPPPATPTASKKSSLSTAVETDCHEDLSFVPVPSDLTPLPSSSRRNRLLSQDYVRRPRTPSEVATVSLGPYPSGVSDDRVDSDAGVFPSSSGGCPPGSSGPTSPDPVTESISTASATEISIDSAPSTAPPTLEGPVEHQPLLQVEANNGRDKLCSKNSLLQCFLIGVLFVSLVVAATVAVADGLVGGLSRYDVRVQQQLLAARQLQLPRGTPKEDMYSGMVIVLPSDDDQQQDHAAHDKHLDPAVLALDANQKHVQYISAADLATAEKKVSEGCHRYYFTHCSKPVIQFYYDPESKACVSTEAHGAQLCNQGSNRFSSLEQCHAKCLQSERVSDRCLENTLFLPCSEQDVAATFWYFDGTVCTRWTFPRGNCPSAERGVYRTFEACYRQCEARGRRKKSADCARPALAPCEVEILRFPYFADMRAKSSDRCINASRRALLTQRCLVGANRFVSQKDCRNTCLK